MILGDLRHYFHQIGLPENAKKYFAAKCDSKFYRSNTLLMGGSWSPHLAQCLSLLLLVHREPMQSPLFDESFRSSERIPTYIPVTWRGKCVGFACIVYDNFGIFLDVDDEDLNIALATRMVNNAKHFGIVWKELHKFNAGGSRNILTPPNKPTKRSRSDEKIEPGKVEKTKLP